MERIVTWQTSAAERRWPFERLEQRLHTYPLYLRASNTVCTHGECATPNTRAESRRAPVRPPTAPPGVACDRVGHDDWERVDMAATFGPITLSVGRSWSWPTPTRATTQRVDREGVADGRIFILLATIHCSGTGESSRGSSRQSRRLRSTDPTQPYTSETRLLSRPTPRTRHVCSMPDFDWWKRVDLNEIGRVMFRFEHVAA